MTYNLIYCGVTDYICVLVLFHGFFFCVLVVLASGCEVIQLKDLCWKYMKYNVCE